MKHLNIRVHGLVQGVFFRGNAKEKADELDIKGFARNEQDGSVYLEAEGEENNLDKFLKWCNKGPMMAQVEKVIFEKGQVKNFSQFEIY